MSVAARLLMAGKRVAYVAEACVHHSHNYSLVQEFRRYFDTGVFHARSPWLLQEFGTANSEGLRFVRSEISFLMPNFTKEFQKYFGKTVCLEK
jgi:rhamnosyltransferase